MLLWAGRLGRGTRSVKRSVLADVCVLEGGLGERCDGARESDVLLRHSNTNGMALDESVLSAEHEPSSGCDWLRRVSVCVEAVARKKIERRCGKTKKAAS